jgi:predicted CXXCH cytochrome family protein
MKKNPLIMAAIIFAALLVFQSGMRAETCVTSACHQNFKLIKRPHAPVNDSCLDCHQKTGEHKFKLMANGRDLCYQCHENKEQKKFVHEGLKSEECQFCHDPHGSDNKALLKTSRIDSLCYKCHDQSSGKRKYVHGPMAAGDCSICHDAHSADHPNLLLAAKETLCLSCHTDKDFTAPGKHVHTPLRKGCDGCHDSHSSDFPFQLQSTAEKLCGRCHEPMLQKIVNAKSKHPAVAEGQSCLNCHDAHGSVFARNLKQDPLHLCLNCHNKPIIGSDGKDYNVFTIVTGNKQKHGPVADGNCSACHDPHGADFYKILKLSYPENFYTPYEEGKYGLCFNCHDKMLAKDEKTDTRTNFRDGNRNLHYVHVNKIKGRTCRACHEIHAGSLPKLIRLETPFGKWDIPIEFEKKENGGSCSPGCHQSFTYDRRKMEQKK